MCEKPSDSSVFNDGSDGFLRNEQNIINDNLTHHAVDDKTIILPQEQQQTHAIKLKLLAIGAVAGLFGGFFGLGGGIVIVPALVFLMGFNQRQAASTSAVALFPVSLIGVLSYSLHGAVNWAAGFALALGMLLGVNLGSRLLQRLPLRVLEWLFFSFLLIAIALLWLVVPSRNTNIEMSWAVFGLLICCGFIPGVAMTLLGVGGGIIAIPLLITGFGASDLIAKGTSLLMVAAGSFNSLIKQLYTSAANARHAILIGLAAALTTPISVQFAVLLAPLASNILFSVLVLFVAAQYLFKLRRKP